MKGPPRYFLECRFTRSTGSPNENRWLHVRFTRSVHVNTTLIGIRRESISLKPRYFRYGFANLHFYWSLLTRTRISFGLHKSYAGGDCLPFESGEPIGLKISDGRAGRIIFNAQTARKTVRRVFVR